MMLGAAAALAAAAVWALTSLLWRRLGERLSPHEMNVGKCALGTLYLGLAVAATGATRPDGRTFAALAASGILGIALGDNLYFRSLLGLGPRLSTLLGALAPIATAAAAMLVLGERPSPRAWLGIVTACAGLAWVLTDGRSSGGGKEWSVGLRAGVLALLCSAAATILSKLGVAGVPALEAALIRIAAGLGALLLWDGTRGRLGATFAALRGDGRPFALAGIVFLSTFGGFWLTLVALKRADAWLASLLLSTTPLFVLPMTALAYGERVRARALAGTLIVVAGVTLVLSGR